MSIEQNIQQIKETQQRMLGILTHLMDDHQSGSRKDNSEVWLDYHSLHELMPMYTLGGLKNLVREKRIPYNKVEGRIVFNKQRILDWLDRNKIPELK